VTCFQSFSFVITATFQADATRGHDGFGGVDEGFFGGIDDVRRHHHHHLVLYYICAPSRPQGVVLTLIPLQIHSSLAWPRSTIAFGPTVLNLLNL
jgi:hypothetical protein